MARTKKSAAQLQHEIDAALATTSGASVGDPKRLHAVARSIQHDKRQEIQDRFPIGTVVKATTRTAFYDHLSKVTGYDLGLDEDAPLVKVRFLVPVKVGSQSVQTAKFHDDEIVTVSKEQRAVDKLLERMKLLEDKHLATREELRLAGRESDGVYDDETHGHAVTPARKAAAEKRWANAVYAERDLTTKMRKIVLKIRVIDPTRVPWAWRNTK